MKWLSIATQNKRGESKSNKREGTKKGGVVERGGAVRREKRKRKRKRNKKRKKKDDGWVVWVVGFGFGFLFRVSFSNKI